MSETPGGIPVTEISSPRKVDNNTASKEVDNKNNVPSNSFWGRFFNRMRHTSRNEAAAVAFAVPLFTLGAADILHNGLDTNHINLQTNPNVSEISNTTPARVETSESFPKIRKQLAELLPNAKMPGIDSTKKLSDYGTVTVLDDIALKNMGYSSNEEIHGTIVSDIGMIRRSLPVQTAGTELPPATWEDNGNSVNFLGLVVTQQGDVQTEWGIQLNKVGQISFVAINQTSDAHTPPEVFVQLQPAQPSA